MVITKENSKTCSLETVVSVSKLEDIENGLDLGLDEKVLTSQCNKAVITPL